MTASPRTRCRATATSGADFGQGVRVHGLALESGQLEAVEATVSRLDGSLAVGKGEVTWTAGALVGAAALAAVKGACECCASGSSGAVRRRSAADITVCNRVTRTVAAPRALSLLTNAQGIVLMPRKDKSRRSPATRLSRTSRFRSGDCEGWLADVATGEPLAPQAWQCSRCSYVNNLLFFHRAPAAGGGGGGRGRSLGGRRPPNSGGRVRALHPAQHGQGFGLQQLGSPEQQL